jgi:hypothetical protein
MNSKQRRQDARKWRYNVPLHYSRVDHNGYDTMFDWCSDTWGNGKKCAGWREAHGHIGTRWQFTDEKKAVLFAMRWK